MKHQPVLLVLSLAVAAPGAWGDIWYVDGSVASPGDGRSWAGAFQFLQDALYEPGLDAGDEIRVAAGTYLPDRYAGAPYGTGDLTESFELRSNVAVYGGFPPGGGPWATRDPAAWPAVLSGDILGLAPEAFEGCGSPEGGAGDCFTPTTGITGCTNGFCCALVCDADPYCCVNGWDALCVSVADNVCVGNATVTALGAGQGIRLDGFKISDGTAVGSVAFVEPNLYYGGGMRAGYGGGQVVIANCTFTGNVAEYGGALAITKGTVHVVNCRFEGNQALLGGAVYVNYNGNAVLANCLLAGNSATEGPGGGVYADTVGDVDLINCTLVENLSTSHNIAAYKVSQIANCIFRGSGSYSIYEAGSVMNTCVEGEVTGPGNIDADPLFVAAAAGDYRLSLASPCLDAGDAGALPQDVADLDADLQTDEPTPLDLQMIRRVLDGGVDMGAFERCRHDLSGDDRISVDDVLSLLSAWGTDPGGPPDFDGNGTVGAADLLELLSSWTDCA